MTGPDCADFIVALVESCSSSARLCGATPRLLHRGSLMLDAIVSALRSRGRADEGSRLARADRGTPRRTGPSGHGQGGARRQPQGAGAEIRTRQPRTLRSLPSPLPAPDAVACRPATDRVMEAAEHLVRPS
jgi:hypothetical protein